MISTARSNYLAILRNKSPATYNDSVEKKELKFSIFDEKGQ
jgi:hypothetical protein